jgi:hypothetical protein
MGLFFFQEVTITIDNLFGPESKDKKSRTLRLRVIKPID